MGKNKKDRDLPRPRFESKEGSYHAVENMGMPESGMRKEIRELDAPPPPLIQLHRPRRIRRKSYIVAVLHSATARQHASPEYSGETGPSPAADPPLPIWHQDVPIKPGEKGYNLRTMPKPTPDSF